MKTSFSFKFFKPVVTALMLMFAGNIMAQYFVAYPKLAPADTVPNDSVIISEVLPTNSGSHGYLEITNNCSRTINLANFFFQGRYPFRGEDFLSPSANRANLTGTLAPGKSFILLLPTPNGALDPFNNFLYPGAYFSPKALYEASDMIYVGESMRYFNQYALYSRYLNTATQKIDSAIIDVFNVKANDVASNAPIAGFSGSNITKVWVRKSNIVTGNRTNWDLSRGTDLVDSEWLPLPRSSVGKYYDMQYSTLKNFKMGNIATIKPLNGIQTDFANKRVTLPYGISRDSVFRKFNYGPGIGWEFAFGPLDSANHYVQNGDTLIFYELTNTLSTYKLVATVNAPDNGFNKVRPVRLPNGNRTLFSPVYHISDGYSPDSISGMPFAIRTDTLLKYVVVEAGCSYIWNFVDGVTRPDLKYGDQLIVSAPNGNKKVYKITPDAYFPSHEAMLKTVVFPGVNVFVNQKTYDVTDTLYTFINTQPNYNIALPSEVEQVPPMIVTLMSDKARYKIERAKNLTGTVAERTTKVVVTAEDDTTKFTYNFVFELKREEPALDYTLFFSDLATDWGSFINGYTTQIYNPFDEPVDFSEYFLCNANDNSFNATTFMTAKVKNNANPDQWIFRPGFRPIKDITGEVFWQIDPYQSRTNIMPKSVFNITHARGYPFEGNGASVELYDKVDLRVFGPNLPYYDNLLKQTIPDIYGTKKSVWHNFTTWHCGQLGKSYWLYKIKNDSVKDGLKPIYDLKNDYEVVDVINGWSFQSKSWLIFDRVNGRDTVYDGAYKPWVSTSNLYRKPEVYKGNPVEHGSFGYGDIDGITKKVTVGQVGEWVDYSGEAIVVAGDRSDQNRPDATSRKRFGHHTMNYSGHIPYVTSNVYLVSLGISDVQTISGMPQTTTVGELLANLNKPNSNMKLVVRNASKLPKQNNDVLESTDMLTSYSARGLDSVVYKFVFGLLDNNITISSSKYVITVSSDKKTGVISGIEFGSTLKAVFEALQKPALAKMYATDGAAGIVPFETTTFDTLLIKQGLRAQTKATSATFAEVVAQNGDKCIYSLQFKAASLPILLSNVYTVNNAGKFVDAVILTSVQNLLSKLYTMPGYKLKVINKLGQDRPSGGIFSDDKVVMYNENNPQEQYAYYLNCFNEQIFDAVAENRVSLVSVFPNPTSGKITVSAKGLQHIKILDFSGRVVCNIAAKGNAMNVSLPKVGGVYFVTVKYSDKTETHKIVNIN